MFVWLLAKKICSKQRRRTWNSCDSMTWPPMRVFR